jgi:oligogalacturonide transport system substrate-binding protein
MKRNKKILALILALVMCLATLAACATDDPAPTPAPTTPAPATPAPATPEPTLPPPPDVPDFVMPTDPVTLSFSWWGNDDRAAAVQAAIDIFTDRYPNVTINPEPNSAAFVEVTEAMIIRLGAGTEADINQVNYSWVHTFARGENPFADLREFGHIIDFTQFTGTDIGLMTLPNGEVGGLPHNMNCRMLLYNKEFLSEFGLTEMPTNFNDWLALAELISADNDVIDTGNNRYAHVPFSNLDIDHYILTMLYSMTGKENVVGGQFNYTVDEIRAVLDLVLAFDAVGGQPSFENHDPINNRENAVWTSGRALASFQWINNPMADGAPYGGGDRLAEMSLAPWPQPAGNVVAVARPGLGHAISKNSAHPEVAAYFLNFFYTDPDAIRAVGSQLGIPIARDAFAIMDAEGLIHPLAAYGLEVMNSLPVGPMGAFWEDGTLRNPRYAIYDEVRTGRITTQQAAERLVQEQQQALDVLNR